MSATILLVDPDIKVHQTLTRCVEEATHELLCAYSAKQAFAILDQRSVDLILTELSLPDMRGPLFVNQVKHVANVVVYTGENHAEDIVLRAFEEGADDYIVKSRVSTKELIYRITAILRRRTPTSISLKNIRVDIQLQKVWWKGVEIELHRQCSLFLFELLQYPNTVRTRRQLLTAVRNDLGNIDYGILRVFAYRIRQRIEENPDQPQHLINVHGVGYIFKP